MEQPNPTLGYWIDLFKKISLFGGLFTGTGLAVLYFFGIAIYTTYNSMLGIPPFEFSLQKCLETGGSSAVALLTLLPAMLVIGIGDNLKEAGFAIFFFFSIPLILLIFLRVLKSFTRSWRRRLQNIIQWGLLIYVGFFLIVMYATLLSSYTTRDLLLNSDVNTLIEHRETLLKNMQLDTVGLSHMDYWTANIVVQNEEWVYGKIGALYSVTVLFLVYAWLSYRVSGQHIEQLMKTGNSRPKWFIYMRRVFILAFMMFLVSIGFVIPARTVTLSSLTRPMVDADIQGLENLTSKYNFVLVGDYDNRYAFYLPNKQDVIVVSKDNVKSVTLLSPVSIFADRRLFIKAAAGD